VSVQMQWNLPEDAGTVTYQPAPDVAPDCHGIRLANAAGPYIGEHLIVYGEVEVLKAWAVKIVAAVAQLPDPEPRFEYADIPPHPEPEPPRVVDLMQALEDSVAAAKEARRAQRQQSREQEQEAAGNDRYDQERDR
jgi:hypothetical protein